MSKPNEVERVKQQMTAVVHGGQVIVERLIDEAVKGIDELTDAVQGLRPAKAQAGLIVATMFHIERNRDAPVRYSTENAVCERMLKLAETDGFNRV